VGRKLEFEPSEALEKAMRVFWEYGYARTSIEDLENATGVGRKSLYRAFQDKHDLFLRALGGYRQMIAEVHLAPLRQEAAGVAEVRALLGRLVQLGASPLGHMGCMICNTALEMAGEDPEAARHVAGYFEEVRAALRTALGQAAARGELQLAGAELEQRVNILFGAIQSLCVLGRARAEPKVLADVAEGALAALG
jgi:TetR/AcrR family transcriptional repressor of nem operon